MNTTLKRVIYPIYAYCLLTELIFIYPVYAVMFQDKGLDPVHISVLFTIWSATVFCLEIPSGAVADKYSRKQILLFSVVLKASGFACWLLFPSFWGFAAGFIGWGIAEAFSGGTFEALVYDELKHHGVEGEYARVMGRARSMMRIGGLVACVSASPMTRFGYGFLITASLISLAFSSAAVLMIRPAKRSGPAYEAHYLTYLKEGVREAVKNRVILRLIVFVCIAVTFYGTLDEYWNLFAKEAGVPLARLGIFYGVLGIADVVGSAAAHRFERFPDRTFYGMFLLSGILLLGASYMMDLVSMLLALTFCFLLTIIDVIMDARLQHAIEVNARATVSSVRNFAGEVSAVPLYMGIGLVSGQWGYRGGFLASAAAMILIGLIYSISQRKNGRA